MSALEIVTLMNREDVKVPRAIRRELPKIAEAIDVIAKRLSTNGRLIFVGSGTSGRVGAMDACECPPTFGTPANLVQYVIAGGDRALANASESSEDSIEAGRSDMAANRVGKRDVVVGIAASGRTPYTLAALEYANGKGAATIAVVCNKGSALAEAANIGIEVEVGPEVLTGSTRLKAGTAQKLICNMLTTGAMARLGYVFGNLMVNLQVKNEKLFERGVSIIQKTTAANRATALMAMEAAGRKTPVAIVMLKARCNAIQAKRRLKVARGSLRKAIQS
jgi:N-acetylmuramic acid 6-phosphate etherase